jgi:hypothetical protein
MKALLENKNMKWSYFSSENRQVNDSEITITLKPAKPELPVLGQMSLFSL